MTTRAEEELFTIVMASALALTVRGSSGEA